MIAPPHGQARNPGRRPGLTDTKSTSSLAAKKAPPVHHRQAKADGGEDWTHDGALRAGSQPCPGELCSQVSAGPRHLHRLIRLHSTSKTPEPSLPRQTAGVTPVAAQARPGVTRRYRGGFEATNDVPEAAISHDAVEESVTLAELDASVGTGPRCPSTRSRCATTPTEHSWPRSGSAATASSVPDDTSYLRLQGDACDVGSSPSGHLPNNSQHIPKTMSTLRCCATVKSATSIWSFGALVIAGVLIEPKVVEIADFDIDPDYWEMIANDPND